MSAPFSDPMASLTTCRGVPTHGAKELPTLKKKEDYLMTSDEVEALIKAKTRNTVRIRRLEERVGDSVAFLSYSIDDQNSMTIWHTEVSPSLQNVGLGGKLVEEALQLALRDSSHLRIVCPFANEHLARHPELKERYSVAAQAVISDEKSLSARQNHTRRASTRLQRNLRRYMSADSEDHAGYGRPRTYEEARMKATTALHELGQSLWLDNITRDLLENGTLKRYIDDFSVTGLTSNPTIFEHAILNSGSYDTQIARLMKAGYTAEDVFVALALQDLIQAADLLADIHESTAGVDGFVSLELSPLMAYHTNKSIAAAKLLHDRGNRPNLYIKIPGTTQGIPAIEESIANGVAINVTLLFSRDHYQASAEAYLRGLERRIERGLSPDVSSVASVFLSRWDGATMDKVPNTLRNKLGIAVGQQVYKAYRDLLESDRWQRLANFGARPQRLLFASTGTKDPGASDVLYVNALAAPNTINTMPEKTLVAFGDHGEVSRTLPRDGGDCESVLNGFQNAGIDLGRLAGDLQAQGAKSFEKSWRRLISAIEEKGNAVL
jgi:transaldolase